VRFENLKKICEEHLPGQYTIEIIDLLKKSAAGGRRSDHRHSHAGAEPAGADQAIIGDLSNVERTLVGLDLRKNDSVKGS